LRDNLEEPYEQELSKGGVLLMVWLRDPEQAPKAHEILRRWGGRAVRDYTSEPDTPTGVLSPA
jgi:hypothetical protein